MDVLIPLFFIYNREEEQETQKEERLMEEKKKKKQEEKKKKEGAQKKVGCSAASAPRPAPRAACALRASPCAVTAPCWLCDSEM